MGDGRAEGQSAIGDGAQAAISLTPDDDGTGSGSLLESDAHSHLEGSYVGLLLYFKLSPASKPSPKPLNLRGTLPLFFTWITSPLEVHQLRAIPSKTHPSPPTARRASWAEWSSGVFPEHPLG